MSKQDAVYAKITLDYPFVSGEGKEVTELTVRRAKARDFRAALSKTGTEVDKEVCLLARICDLTIEDIDELDLADYVKVQAVLIEMQAGKSE